MTKLRPFNRMGRAMDFIRTPFFRSADMALTKDAPPGSLIFVGKQKMGAPEVELIQYEKDKFSEEVLPGIDVLLSKLRADEKSWVNVNGLHDTTLVETIGKQLNLNVLLLEDILDTTQRPKIELYDDHLFIVLRMIQYDETTNHIFSEQVSMVLGKDHLFTFQEAKGDAFDSVRERLRTARTKIRERSMDYLPYALLDAIVDNYTYTIERFGDKIDELDTQILTRAEPITLDQIRAFKREINYLRKVVRPVREIVVQMEKSNFFLDDNHSYIRDLVDHITYAAESIETYQVLLSDLLNIYHTNASNRLNDIIRLLTLYSVIFIPMTFLAGIYGMNFEHFPELHYKYAYPIFWGVMLLISGSMIFYFKRKRWL